MIASLIENKAVMCKSMHNLTFHNSSSFLYNLTKSFAILFFTLSTRCNFLRISGSLQSLYLYLMLSPTKGSPITPNWPRSSWYPVWVLLNSNIHLFTFLTLSSMFLLVGRLESQYLGAYNKLEITILCLLFCLLSDINKDSNWHIML